MEVAVLIFIGFAAWFGYHVFKGCKGQTPAAKISSSGRAISAAVKPQCQLRYCDAYGEITTREIAFVNNYASDNTFDAWCFLRNEMRTFRFDGVLRVVVLETGELGSAGGIFKAYFPDKVAPANLRHPAAWRVAGALVSYTRASGRGIKAREKEIIRSAVNTVCGAEAPNEDDFGTIIRVAGVLEVVIAVNRLEADELILCRQAALEIARGSGRKAPDPDVLAAAAETFAGSNRV